MTKEIRLQISEETARNIISALEHEVDIIQPPEEREQLIRDGYEWNENTAVAELHQVIFRLKWEFDIDHTQTDAVRHLELLEE